MRHPAPTAPSINPKQKRRDGPASGQESMPAASIHQGPRLWQQPLATFIGEVPGVCALGIQTGGMVPHAVSEDD
jgi:hypothetical protein